MGLGRLIKQGVSAIAPRSVLMHGARSRPEVAITFDDGPHPEQTPRVLEALAREGATATFFLQGDHAAAWPQWVREIHRAGHQVANHSYRHVRASEVAAADFVADVKRTHELLQDIVGQAIPPDVRPPYGDITPRTFLSLASQGFRFVFWTVDSDDSSMTEAQGLLAHVTTLGIGAGDIVLFHEDYPHTVAALPSLLAHWRQAGLSMLRVDRLAPNSTASKQASTVT